MSADALSAARRRRAAPPPAPDFDEDRAAAAEESGPLFKPFKWVHEDDAQSLPPDEVAKFIAGARDAAAGAAVIARIIETDRVNGEISAESPVLDTQATADLSNLAAWALEALVDRADSLINKMQRAAAS